jgi:hypothetical protein
MTPEQLFDELKKMNDCQLNDVVVLCRLDPSMLRTSEALKERAFEIWKMISGRPELIEGIDPVIEKVKTSTHGYFYERLRHIKDYLVEPPWPKEGRVGTGTVKELKNNLKKKVGKLDEPQLVTVRGTLFPAALLTAGWWERKRVEKVKIGWKKTLQQWLFEGFDYWAPSWDISWDFDRAAPLAKPYFIAQLTEGDEADSIAVIIPAEKAKEIREQFMDPSGWGGFEAEVTGILGHRHQFSELPPEEGEASDYYIGLRRDEKKHRIEPLMAAKTELYSGYVWKCLMPREWARKDGSVSLDQVYLVWEHTNFAAQDARQYNMDGLAHKEELIHKLHPGGLILLQKSHNFVEGKPEWESDEVYRLLAGKSVKAPAGATGG